MEIKSTDRDNFKLIYQQNYQTIMQVIVHIVYNLEIAQDLTQETFIKFYQKNMTFKSEDEAKYWLLKVAKNLALNHVRRNKREDAMIEKVKNVPGSGIVDEDVASNIIDSEEKRELKKALDSLPDKLREVMLLKLYGGLNYKGMSEVLGTSEANIKVRVFRARKELEKYLSREESDVY